MKAWRPRSLNTALANNSRDKWVRSCAIGVAVTVVWARLWVLAGDTSKGILDFDTQRLFIESNMSIPWAERLDIWATTPHPFGLLIQQAYVQGAQTITGSTPYRVWSWAILLSLFFFFLSLWLLGSLHQQKSPQRALLVIVIGLAPAVAYVYHSKEEDAFGLLFFIGALLLAQRVLTKSSRHSLTLYSVTLLWALFVSLWHLQYGLTLAFASAITVAIAWAAQQKERRKPTREHLLLISVSLLTTTSLIVLHLIGLVRFVPYQSDFSNLLKALESGQLLSYLHEFSLASQRAMTGLRLENPFVSFFAFVWLLILIGFLWLLYIQREDIATLFLVAVGMTGLLIPLIYEPLSLERWTVATIAVPAALVVVGSRNKMRRQDSTA